MSRGKKWILRGLAVLGILCALGAALVFGLSGYVVLSTRQQFRTLEDTPPEAVDCILVLGCGVYADGTPTPMLSDRLTRGVELYQAGWADKLLMSGDNRSQDYNELATMHRVALEKGVPQADVVLDYAGLSTYDSLYRARDIFGVKKVVIVTQEYHMYRALYLARALGLEACRRAELPGADHAGPPGNPGPGQGCPLGHLPAGAHLLRRPGTPDGHTITETRGPPPHCGRGRFLPMGGLDDEKMDASPSGRPGRCLGGVLLCRRFVCGAARQRRCRG